MTEYLTPAQAAAVIGVTPKRVIQIANAGRLACIRTPLGRLFVPAEVEAYRAARAAR